MDRRTSIPNGVLCIAAMIVLFMPSRGQGAELRFVPPASAHSTATLELRSSASITGGEIALADVCRWSDADAQVFNPVGGLILARIAPGAPLRSITLDEVRSALRDAGINLARVRFAGAVSCAITLVDGAPPAGLPAREAGRPPVPGVEGRTPSPGTSGEDWGEGLPGDSPYTLRHQLIEDLAQRLRLPPQALQVQFHPKDDAVLNRSARQNRFHIDPRRGRDLGEVTWDVTLINDQGSEKIVINAHARAWQQQLTVTRPIAPRQLIRDEDLAEQRVLVDRLSDDPLLQRPQVVGQQAARELRPGTVITARLIEAAPLVRSGQLVTITLSSGGVQITTVARAMESGAYGQTIRVRNESTRDTFEAVVTGPQTAALGQQVR